MGEEPAAHDSGQPWESLKAECASAPIEGDAVHKTYRAGTHRTVAPDETLARIRPLMPAMGTNAISSPATW
jgi:hypothetical protein